jgi:hypothetical protein
MDMEARTRPRRGAPQKREVSARERILRTACELFYREGMEANGIRFTCRRFGKATSDELRSITPCRSLLDPPTNQPGGGQNKGQFSVKISASPGQVSVEIKTAAPRSSFPDPRQHIGYVTHGLYETFHEDTVSKNSELV